MNIPITDPADPGLDAYRALRARENRSASGQFIAESRIVVQRLLASSIGVESILCTSNAAHELHAIHARHPELPVYCLPADQVRALVGYKVTRGMLAVARQPANPTLANLLAAADLTAPIVVICPHVTDPVNLAGIVRNAAAFGVAAIILGDRSTAPYCRRVARVSMGTLFQMPLRISDNLAADLDQLATRGFSRFATVLDPAATPIMDVPAPEKLALVFGSEGPGLDPAIIERCDKQVTLPMLNSTDSLNLSTATGIFLYHFRFARPRHCKP